MSGYAYKDIDALEEELIVLFDRYGLWVQSIDSGSHIAASERARSTEFTIKVISSKRQSSERVRKQSETVSQLAVAINKSLPTFKEASDNIAKSLSEMNAISRAK